MSKYSYASAETIVQMIREKTLEYVEETAKEMYVDTQSGIKMIAGGVRMANIIIDEMQKEDSDDSK